jgi:hypothetical protein
MTKDRLKRFSGLSVFFFQKFRNDRSGDKMREGLFLHRVSGRLVVRRFLQDLDISNIVLTL